MKKPIPPDQERVELIISGDDPESHRVAQETARILAAPQMAKALQRRIDECREEIASVFCLLSITNGMRYQLSAYFSNFPKPIHPNIQVEFRDLILSLDQPGDYCGYGCYSLTYEGQKSRDTLKKLLSRRLEELQDEIKKYKEQIDNLFALVQGK